MYGIAACTAKGAHYSRIGHRHGLPGTQHAHMLLVHVAADRLLEAQGTRSGRTVIDGNWAQCNSSIKLAAGVVALRMMHESSSADPGDHLVGGTSGVAVSTSSR